MASRPDSGSPWPNPTPHASSSKGKRKWDPSANQPPRRFRKFPRQSSIATVADDSCGHVSNDVILCYPTVDSINLQDEWTRAIWNTNLPQFSQTNLVDIYLTHGDSDQPVFMKSNVSYLDGHLSVQINDTWWGEKGAAFTPGKNATQTFFFRLVRSGASQDSQPPQATFTATQTDFPNSIRSSMSAASLASASASSASTELSKSAAVSSASSSSSAAAAASNAALQKGSNSSDDFPRWAIALLAVFGFLAFVSVLFVFWLLIRNLRSRRNTAEKARRNSIGSQSPMMANAAPQSPVGAAPSSIAHGDPQSIEGGIAPLPVINPNRHNVVSSDGASTVSRADSAGGPISAVDAAAMAAAFRNIMRKPDFADRPMEEGESPEHREADVLNRELAEEGRDIRSVSSSRDVKVETLSDSGDTVQH